MELVIIIVGFFVAITVHEFMHAWVSNYLGDSTAKHLGRMTLNPIPHIDPVGTLLLPAILIIAQAPFILGYAKPVPINPNNFKNPRAGLALSSLAGPMGNLIVALILALSLNLIPQIDYSVGKAIGTIIVINVVLMVFNLIPIPPLDGSKIFAGIFPILENPKLETWGPLILIALLFVGGFAILNPIINFIVLEILQVNPMYFIGV